MNTDKANLYNILERLGYFSLLTEKEEQANYDTILQKVRFYKRIFIPMTLGIAGVFFSYAFFQNSSFISFLESDKCYPAIVLTFTAMILSLLIHMVLTFKDPAVYKASKIIHDNQEQRNKIAFHMYEKENLLALFQYLRTSPEYANNTQIQSDIELVFEHFEQSMASATKYERQQAIYKLLGHLNSEQSKGSKPVIKELTLKEKLSAFLGDKKTDTTSVSVGDSMNNIAMDENINNRTQYSYMK